MIDRTPEFTSILHDCLDSVLAGERSIDECLQAYPQFASRLKPALQVALLTRDLDKAEMPASSVQALEIRLRGKMVAANQRAATTGDISSRRSAFAPLGKLAAMIAIVFLFALGTGGGAVAASASSLPGDPLYGLKRLWEAIILALSSLANNTDDVWLHLAQTRLDEAESLAGRGTVSSVVFADVYEATAQAILLVDEATLPQLTAFLENARSRIQNLPATAATAPLQRDLLLLVVPAADGKPGMPPSLQPPSLQPTMMSIESSGMDTFTPTVTPAPTETPTLALTSTATPAPSATQTVRPTDTPSATLTPTSRVPATATNSPQPSRTPTQTSTPSVTPTATWTALPLVTATFAGDGLPPTSAPVNRPTDDDQNGNVPVATIRHRATQAAAYATQTRQAELETEEPRP